MLKMLLPLIISSTMKFPHMSMFPIILTSLTLMFLKMKNMNMLMIINKYIFLDMLSMIMIMLSMFVSLLIIMSSPNMMMVYTKIILIMNILIINFSSMNLFMFYISFEIVLIPTFMLITSTGYQNERLQATIYLLMYTITTSLPLLIGISLMKTNSMLLFTSISFSMNYPLLFIMAFLIKMPMFFTHLWLPKAHVEAPLEGSMILAAVLLKLGGYGVIRFMPMIFTKMMNMNTWFISLSMIGASLTSMNCLRQKDLKSMIAYSSVAHMALILASMMTLNSLGKSGAITMMIAHGLSSSALFLLVNIIYLKYHTRNIISFKGLMNLSPNLTFWWFIFIMINISAPPTINLLSEILMIMSMMSWNMTTFIMISLTSLMTTIFSISLFINITHNKTETMPMKTTENKLFLILFMHSSPLIMLITKTELMV